MASPAPVDEVRLDHGATVDVDAVMVVMDDAFGDRFGEAWTRSQLTGILPMAGVRLTVARSVADDAIAGFSLTRSAADEAELLLIAVASSMRRRGIALRLLLDFCDRAAEDGIRHLHLEVRDGNPAVAMYRDQGFVPVGRRRNYYRGSDGSRHDAITLAQEIVIEP